MVAGVPHSVAWQAVEVVAFAVNCTAPLMMKALVQARLQAATVGTVCPCLAALGLHTCEGETTLFRHHVFAC